MSDDTKPNLEEAIAIISSPESAELLKATSDRELILKLVGVLMGLKNEVRLLKKRVDSIGLGD